MTPEKLGDESQNINPSIPERTESSSLHQSAGIDDEPWRHNMSFMDSAEPALTQSNVPNSSKPQDFIPWGKVALVALLTPILVFILYQQMGEMLVGLGIAIGFVVIVLVPVIYTLPVVVPLAISGKFLEKNAVKYSYFHVFFAGFFALMSFLVAYKYLSPILAANSRDLDMTLALIGGAAIYLGFVIGLFGSIWFIHKTFDGTYATPIKIFILTVTVGMTTVIAYKAPEPSFPNAKTALETWQEEKAAANALRNNALKSWLYVPKYNIPGTTGNEDCYQMEELSKTPECTIRFSESPAYLSDETFSTLTNGLKDVYASLKNYPLMEVQIGKNDEMLEPFKIKNGKCNLPRLGTALQADYKGVARTTYKPENSKICNSLVTPKGTQLVYESPLGYSEEYAKIPTTLYFEKGNNVVVIHLAMGWPPYIEKSTIAEVIAGAPETQEEIFSFVDGFEPIGN